MRFALSVPWAQTLAVGLATFAAVPALAASGAAGPGHAHAVRGRGRGRGVRLELRPAVARLRQRVTLEVSGTRASSLQALPTGATDQLGLHIGWQSLKHATGAWWTVLPAPARPGIYPLRLRVRAGLSGFRSPGWFLRVLSPGTLSRPAFVDPRGVVSWWVHTVAHADLVALRRWPLPGYDHRDRRLHCLFVVAYSPPGDSDPGDRRGLFVTAFRNGYGARWRLLETGLVPT